MPGKDHAPWEQVDEEQAAHRAAALCLLPVFLSHLLTLLLYYAQDPDTPFELASWVERETGVEGEGGKK